MPPDGLYGDGEPAEPNAPAAPVGSHAAPESPTREASVDLPDAREPDTLTQLTVTADGGPGLAPVGADRLGQVVPFPSTEPAPATLVNAPDRRPESYGVAERSYATAYGSYQGQVSLSASDGPPAWADEILGGGPFAAGGDEGEPPIWRRYQELVESQVDSELRASVLRAGWLALRGRIGGEA